MESWNKLQNRFEINILTYVRANTTEYTPRENLTLVFFLPGTLHGTSFLNTFILFVDYKVTIQVPRLSLTEFTNAVNNYSDLTFYFTYSIKISNLRVSGKTHLAWSSQFWILTIKRKLKIILQHNH